MKSFLYHVQINVSDKKISFPFYKDLLGYLGYRVLHEDDWVLGMSNKTADVWLVATREEHKEAGFHRKGVGLNHMAFGVDTREEVGHFIENFLKPRGIKPLYDSPRHYPEYQEGYYAVFFEDPDRMKLEVTYIPTLKSRF